MQLGFTTVFTLKMLALGAETVSWCMKLVYERLEVSFDSDIAGMRPPSMRTPSQALDSKPYVKQAEMMLDTAFIG